MPTPLTLAAVWREAASRARAKMAEADSIGKLTDVEVVRRQSHSVSFAMKRLADDFDREAAACLSS